MNYYIEKSLKYYQYTLWDDKKLSTNINLIKALYSIELAHRNLLWRLIEYLYWILLPRNFSDKRMLTIGKFQIRTIYLTHKSKIRNIIYSNKIETIDRLLYDNFPDADWLLLSDSLLTKIVSFYNGDKTGVYLKCVKILLNSMHQ